MNIGKKIIETRKPFFSLEFFPPKTEGQMEGFYRTVDQLRALNPLFVSVTYGAGGTARKNTLEVTGRLSHMGLTAMAHLTCIGADRDAIYRYLQELTSSGVDNVLALRGDMPKDGSATYYDGPFCYASDLVRFVKAQMPDMGIGVAAYPTPHPESPSLASDRMYTAEKMACGADFAITQLFFDVREYIALVQDLQGKGITCPVIPGILPIQSFDSLRRVLSLCGANIPGKLYLNLEEAHSRGGADAVMEAGLRFAVRQIGQLLDAGAPGIHLYTLNKGDLCMLIARETGLAR